MKLTLSNLKYRFKRLWSKIGQQIMIRKELSRTFDIVILMSNNQVEIMRNQAVMMGRVQAIENTVLTLSGIVKDDGETKQHLAEYIKSVSAVMQHSRTSMEEMHDAQLKLQSQVKNIAEKL